jgi:predicted GNAT family acetyltransferase
MVLGLKSLTAVLLRIPLNLALTPEATQVLTTATAETTDQGNQLRIILPRGHLPFLLLPRELCVVLLSYTSTPKATAVDCDRINQIQWTMLYTLLIRKSRRT